MWSITLLLKHLLVVFLFLLSLASQRLSQVDYLRARRICCASNSLRIPGTLDWRILGVLCSPPRRIPMSQGFVVEGLLCSASLGHLHHWRTWRPPSLRFASSGVLAWRFLGDPCSSGRCSSPGKFPGILDRLAPSALIWTWCFCHPLRRTVASIATCLLGASLVSPVLRVRLFSGASLSCFLNFISSDRVRRLGVL